MTTGAPPGRSLTPASWAKTLLVIPCSKAKQDCTGIGASGATIIDSLPTELAQGLLEARQRVKERTRIDETTLVPAMQRYAGSLYQAASDALYEIAQGGSHIIILSGGYGVVMGSEPIGLYKQILKTSWWPRHILERVLIGVCGLCADRRGGTHNDGRGYAMLGSNATSLGNGVWVHIFGKT